MGPLNVNSPLLSVFAVRKSGDAAIVINGLKIADPFSLISIGYNVTM